MVFLADNFYVRVVCTFVGILMLFQRLGSHGPVSCLYLCSYCVDGVCFHQQQRNNSISNDFYSHCTLSEKKTTKSNIKNDIKTEKRKEKQKLAGYAFTHNLRKCPYGGILYCAIHLSKNIYTSQFDGFIEHSGYG